MKKLFRKTIAMILCFCILISLSLQVLAADDGRVDIKYTIGSNNFDINGVTSKSEKPYTSGKDIMVPLRLILEAIGAEVTWMGNGDVNLVYRNKNIDIHLNSKLYTVNQEEGLLSVAPVLVNGTAMIAVQFIVDNFELVNSYDANTKIYHLVLDDDGALSDLSFLTGSISKAKVGNSYFEWSMNVPKNSRLLYTNFNSNYITIENEHRGIELSIYIESDKNKTLEQYLEELNENPENYTGTTEFEESSIQKVYGTSYIELLYSSYYEEAVVERIYANQGMFYHVALCSYNDTDPRVLKKSSYYKTLLDSFLFGYKGETRDCMDLSSVRFGLAKFENFVQLNDFRNILTWEMSVPPLWDVVSSDESNPYVTKLGISEKEYISIEIGKEEEDLDLQSQIEAVKQSYDENFNPEYYRHISMNASKIGGYEGVELVSQLKFGTAWYTTDEFYFKSGNLIYSVTMKAEISKFQSQREEYMKVLNSLKIYSKNAAALAKDIDTFTYNMEKSTVGKSEKMTTYTDEYNEWSLQLPGNWIVSSDYFSSYTTFEDREKGIGIAVETFENGSYSKNLKDTEKFFILQSLNESEKSEFVSTDTLEEGDRSIVVYTYRLEDDEIEQYEDIKFYIFKEGTTSYCIALMLPDLVSTDKNKSLLESIRTSFKTDITEEDGTLEQPGMYPGV